jgi:hypothetical protein
VRFGPGNAIHKLFPELPRVLKGRERGSWVEEEYLFSTKSIQPHLLTPTVVKGSTNMDSLLIVPRVSVSSYEFFLRCEVLYPLECGDLWFKKCQGKVSHWVLGNGQLLAFCKILPGINWGRQTALEIVT